MGHGDEDNDDDKTVMDYAVDLFVIPSIPSKQLGSLKVAVGVRGSGETEHCRGGDALGVNKFCPSSTISNLSFPTTLSPCGMIGWSAV